MSPLEGSIARANRLLVLDDDPFIPRWIRKVAEHEGYDVSICTDLTTIRAVHRSARPTLILMDLTLGGGYQGLEALRLLSAERSHHAHHPDRDRPNRACCTAPRASA